MLKTKKLGTKNFLSSLDISTEEVDYIIELAKKLKNKDLNIDLKDKLQSLISATLKSDYQALFDYKFDIGYAESSLKYFNTDDIPSINDELHQCIRKVSLKIDLDLI